MGPGSAFYQPQKESNSIQFLNDTQCSECQKIARRPDSHLHPALTVASPQPRASNKKLLVTNGRY